MTTASELKFRHIVRDAMEGRWMMTWHEDRHISPGVPDLHYVVLDDGLDHRVGWLELKSISTELTAQHRIKVEPSQHQYIRRWRPVMPIHFLVRVKQNIYLLDGNHHGALSELSDENTLLSLSLADMPQADIGAVLPAYLKIITRVL